MTPSAKSTAPLNGIKILDLTRLLPGPACTLHLADLGADVIKIEDTQLGDYANWEFRALVNRNKHCMRLDLKKEAGQQVLLELVKEAHIFVESFRPGVMQRLGVDYPRLRDRKSTRLNSSHVAISYAVFCLKKKKKGKCHNTSK